MATLFDIRAALAANLSTLRGVQVSAYVLGNPTPPCLWVRPDPSAGIEYHGAMRNGLEFWHMLVQAQVGLLSDIGAQQKLDEMLATSGATSVKAALESDRTLGGVAADLKVDRCSGYQEFGRQDGSTVLGCDWSVTVYMNGG